MKNLLVVTIAAVGIGTLAGAAQAKGFHGHQGSQALRLCMSVMSQSQKANLKTIFENSGLKADRQAVWQAKQALTAAILTSPGTNSAAISTAEKNLGSAQATLQTAEDSVAVQVCQSVPNIAAVQNLNSQLQTLHQSTR
ncbi:MAG: periplasmic heavy metal sensor, partial [Candidatus Binataceae bacterium]